MKLHNFTQTRRNTLKIIKQALNTCKKVQTSFTKTKQTIKIVQNNRQTDNNNENNTNIKKIIETL